MPEVSGKPTKFSLSWSELSGSLGDLGLFVPLVVAMSLTLDLDLGMILILAGLMNVATGLIFGQPIPVQPMKALAAVVIAGELSRGELLAAGLWMGVAMVVLSGGIERLNAWVPRGIVRGIQLGVGCKLAWRGLAEVGALPGTGLDSIAVAVLVTVLLVIFAVRRIPGLLAVFVFGFFVIRWTQPDVLASSEFAWPAFGMAWPAWGAMGGDWLGGAFKGALAQLPLTTLNSVVAVCALSADYFPGRGITPKKMSVSVGLMNLISVPLGGIPMCHGAGGLAAQYRFGARSGSSVIMLGTIKIAAGLFLGGYLMQLLGAYPMSILGPMLLLAGIELARSARDVIGLPHQAITALATAIAILLLNTWAGFLVGLAVHLVLSLAASRSFRD